MAHRAFVNARRTGCVLAAASLVSLSAISTAGAVRGGVHGAGLRASPSSKPAAKSVAFMGIADGVFDSFTGLTHGALKRTGTVDLSDISGESTSSAIDPSGTTAVLSAFGSTLKQLDHLHTSVSALGPDLHLHAFRDEGGADYVAYGSGVALSRTFGLVALDEQGLVQLRLKSGRWAIDKRIQSPGLNEGNNTHQPGFIRFPRPGTNQASTYDSVVVSTLPLSNGKYLALALDRGQSTSSLNCSLAVIEGVGTAKPVVTSVTNSPAFCALQSNGDYGNGGMAFSPATATRAVLATSGGLDVLNLKNPANPKLQNKTLVGTTPAVTSIAIAPDGDHVALGATGHIDLFRGLHNRPAAQPLKPAGQVTPDPSGIFHIAALSFLSNGNLLVERSGFDEATSSTAWFASVVTGSSNNDLSVRSERLQSAPSEDNSMSASPQAATISLRASAHRAKVGTKTAIKLSISGGIGHYRFTVSHGHLPAGLTVHGTKISGTPTHAGTTHVILRALNQYGGAVFASYRLVVRN